MGKGNRQKIDFVDELLVASFLPFRIGVSDSQKIAHKSMRISAMQLQLHADRQQLNENKCRYTNSFEALMSWRYPIDGLRSQKRQ